jgi:hypothetical protein
LELLKVQKWAIELVEMMVDQLEISKDFRKETSKAVGLEMG